MTLTLCWPKKTASEHFMARGLGFMQMLRGCRRKISTGRDTPGIDFAWNPPSGLAGYCAN